MKCSELWLREWVNPHLTRQELGETLTMAGLEIEEISPVAEAFTNVVIGQVLRVEQHPEADRLKVCEVNVGRPEHLSIVCGASNVKAGIRVPVAMIDASLPNQTLITLTSIRNVVSQGMLCSASELGLTEESQGLLELPQDAPIGQDLRTYLKLDDYTIDISITPNRGDCLSVKGVAREVSALTQTPMKEVSIPDIKPAIHDTLSVVVEDKAGCPNYVGRIIRQVKADLTTPMWLKERLRRSGVRSISPVVDVTNYVMLELGQPMHAFDLQTIKEKIHVRQSRAGEKIALLDGSEKELDAETLVIADSEKPLAIAGVMGGLDSSVNLLTRDLFLESAYFSPQTIARQRQHYNLNSDSAYRFERGVDPTIQKQAIERATQLILELAGGEAGPIIEVMHNDYLPKPPVITVSKNKVTQVLGIDIPNNEIESIFARLGFQSKNKKDEWDVHTPPHRFDIALPEDLIEEIARLFGYNKIPTHHLRAELQAPHAEERGRDLHVLRQAFSDQGFYEIISYSFIDKKLQTLLDPNESPCELVNPITAEMTVMRTNLWPGLINTFLYNKSRQQHRVRLFEIGTCFTKQDNKIIQQQRLGGLISGFSYSEQWGVASREVDFYDLKGHLENMLILSYSLDEMVFKPEAHPALHPGQTAGIYYKDQRLGIMGALHPTILQALDLTNKVFVFELDLALLQKPNLPHYHEISKFPEIRRDLAILVNQTVPAKAIQDTIKEVVGDWLKDVFIFDVYQGKGITPGLKSIAVALLLQHPTRTLVDDEVTGLMEKVIAALKGQLGAELRS